VAAVFLSTFNLAAIENAHADKVAQAYQLITDANTAYASLSGYQVTFLKEIKKDDGGLMKETSFMKFEKPFTIYMNLTKGHGTGRQILYSEGKFDDKMMVRPSGFMFSFIPLVPIELDDPRVAKKEKHSIKRAGIGKFLERLTANFGKYRASNQLTVQSIEQVEEDGVKGTVVDFRFDDNDYAYPRTVVTFSQITKLPLKIYLYSSENELAEFYYYQGLRLNTAKDDSAFKHISDPRIFDLFSKTSV